MTTLKQFTSFNIAYHTWMIYQPIHIENKFWIFVLKQIKFPLNQTFLFWVSIFDVASSAPLARDTSTPTEKTRAMRLKMLNTYQWDQSERQKEIQHMSGQTICTFFTKGSNFVNFQTFILFNQIFCIFCFLIFSVNLQPYKTSWGSVSQRRMKSLTGGQSTAQTFKTMSLRGTQ